jgi:HEAT repeat protein
MSDRYDVKALRRHDDATVELRVCIVHPDVDDFPDTKNFALQLLLDALHEAPGPLGEAVSIDQGCDERWMLTNAARFVADVEIVEAAHWPRPPLKALPEDDGGGGAPGETPVAVYRISATSPSHVAHVRPDLVWQTAAYDMGEDGFPDAAREPAPADEPEKPAPHHPAPVPPPDLTVLTARKGQKLRAVLRRSSRVHELLTEAGVYVGALGFVHRETVKTLTPWLLRSLDDEAELVRRSAVRLVGDLGVSEGGEALLRIVESEQPPGLRLLAINALADLPELPAGGPRALARVLGAPPLTAHTQEEHDLAELPTAAATALAQRRPLAPELAPELTAALAREREAMGQVGVDAEQRAIYAQVKTPDWPVVHWLGEALANMGWPALPHLVAALADERSGVRVGVLQAVSQLLIREPEAARAHDAPLARAALLFEDLVKSPVVEVRANAAVALCTRDPRRTLACIGPLGEAAGQPGKWGVAMGVRLQAGRLLAALGDAALPAFWQVLEMRRSVWGRYFENTPLASLGVAARPLMEEALSRWMISRADMAVWSGLVGAPDAFQRLSELTGDPLARHALLARVGPDGLRAIRDLLDAPRADAAHVAWAIAGLGRAGDAADAGPLLARALAHPRAAVRAAAVRALAERGGDSSVTLLGQALGDPRRFVRAAAAGALCRFGEPAGAAALEALWPLDPELVAMTIDAHDAPCIGLRDRLLEALAHPKLASCAADALAAIAAASPPSDARARLVDAVKQTPGSASFRRAREAALAKRGLVPPIDDPFTSGPPAGWLGY